ncbi:melanocyte-stimulating hormone receptor-like [Oculina patagonica]
MATRYNSSEWNVTSGNNSSQPRSSINCFYIDYSRSAVENFYSTYILSIVLNSVCALPASVLNILVILAVWRKSQLHTPSNVLLSNLALTDLGVGCLVQPVFVAHKIAAIHGNISLHCFASLGSKTLGSVLGAVSLTTLTAISIDRLLALVLSVRYRTVVTIRWTIRVVGLLWLTGIILTIPLFIYPMSFLYCMILLLVLCLTVTTLAYAKLFRLIHQHQTKVGVDLQTAGPQSQELTEASNIAKYKSSICTVIFLVILMLLFYSPYLVLNIVLAVVRSNDDRFKAAFNITHTILFMNSLVNPAFYCWKIRRIPNAIKEMLPDRFQQ